MINKSKCIVYSLVIFTLLIFFFMWRNTVVKLDNTCKLLDNAKETISTLTRDNEKLVEYNKRKDEQLKSIEAEYNKKLNNIPKDKCGDIKPSNELLQFLRDSK